MININNNNKKSKRFTKTIVITGAMMVCFSIGVFATTNTLRWTGSSALEESGRFIEQVTVKAVKLNDALTNAQKERDAALNEKNQLQKELEQLRNQANQNGQTINNLQQQIVDKNNKIIEKENVIISKNNEISELSRELETANSQAGRLKGQLDSAKAKLDESGINIWN